jgi:phosphoribosylaminoimidazolecarboxamide formyltransferase/IMP cyclohydrolase
MLKSGLTTSILNRENMSKIKRALVSVSNKTGIVDLAKALVGMKIEILSTGGTAKIIREAGVDVKDVSEHTGSPEMMNGRVKTLHPKVHGGILGRRKLKQDVQEMQKHGIEPIDMVVVNLYPFEETISKKDVTFDDAIENIDIGGPTMLRSAAKNFQDVTVVVNPEDYNSIIGEMQNLGGEVSYKTKARLAKKVFNHTSRYDTLIADYLSGMVEGEAKAFPKSLTMTFKLKSTLRHGENPHQKAAAYLEHSDSLSVFDAKIIQGKEMSFNNYMDTHVALMLALEFQKPACAIIKQTNPCGVALGKGPAEAFVKALKTDPMSAFGGILGFNTTVDASAAKEITKTFVEVIIAPGYSEDSLKVFKTKPSMRLLELFDMRKPLSGSDIKRLAGGLLVQDWDTKEADIRTLSSVTRRDPTEEELEGLEFAWKVSKHVKSDAIVYAIKDRTVGIGIGQTSRIYSARVGAINSIEPLRGSVAASDGFFPFRDGIDGIRKVGVTAIVQPGGSMKDDEVIQAANEHNMAMLFTGVRHFKH